MTRQLQNNSAFVWQSILSSFWRFAFQDTELWLTTFVLVCFLLIALSMSFHCILTSIVSDGKSTVGFIFCALYIKNIFSLPLAMNSLGTMCLMGLTWNFLSFLVLYVILFIRFGKFLSTNLSNIFFQHFSVLSSSGTPVMCALVSSEFEVFIHHNLFFSVLQSG